MTQSTPEGPAASKSSPLATLLGGQDARPLMAVLGFAHGFFFWVLDELADGIHPTPPHLIGWAFVLLGSFFVLHFAANGRDRVRIAVLTCCVGIASGLIAYALAMAVPEASDRLAGEKVRLERWYAMFLPILYVLMPFLQDYQRTGRLHFDYSDLFRDSWNNFFIGALGLLYAGGFWIVLVTWGALFDLIGIAFFEELFEESWFAWPMTGAMLAYGVAAARESEATLSMLREVARSLFRVVYPLMAAVTIGFSATLLVSGLGPLFERTSAAWVMASWQGFAVLFLNAVYGAGEEAPPYSAWIKRLAEGGTLLLPVLGGIGLYAIWLRVDQYGLTPDRFLAVVGLGLLGMYVLGYAVAVLRRGEPWIPMLRPVNRTMAGVVVATGLLLQSPVLDPLSWSVDSQLGRLASGRVTPEAFDYGYLRFRLGRKGGEALERLEAEATKGSVAAKRIEEALSAADYQDWGPDAGLVLLAKEPIVLADAAARAGEILPEDLVAALGQLSTSDHSIRECGQSFRCLAFPAPVSGGDVRDWLVFAELDGWSRILVFAPPSADQDRFEYIGQFIYDHHAGLASSELAERIQAGEIEAKPSRFRDLEVEGRRLRFEPGERFGR